jgi:hypothetical protein
MTMFAVVGLPDNQVDVDLTYALACRLMVKMSIGSSTPELVCAVMEGAMEVSDSRCRCDDDLWSTTSRWGQSRYSGTCRAAEVLGEGSRTRVVKLRRQL